MTVLFAGLCTIDVVQRVEELPAPGEKVQSSSVALAAGGPATNAAVTVAALGERATLLTALGSHPLAALARVDLAACGVEVLDAAPGFAGPPALSTVAVRERDGERTVVSRNAGEARFARPPLAVEARTVLVDGHHPELALGAARWARERGVPVVLDAGSWKPVFDDLLPLVDVAACSARLAGSVTDLLNRGDGTVVLTAGPDPVRWWTGAASGAVPVPVVQAVDTLGAGDVWHGAFAYGVGKFELPEQIRFANEVAAERVRHSGPRRWVSRIGAR